MLSFDSSEITHVGSVREVNEDSILSRAENGLWVVADGMGGYEAGDLASSMLVEALSDIPLENSISANINTIEKAINDVNQKIIEHSEIEFGGRVFGSTVVAVFFQDTFGSVLWAGDSRLYRLRANTLSRLTKDHSQLQEMLDSNLLLPEEIENYPDQNVITRAVGAEKDLMLDFQVFEIEEDDKFLLCSDGLYNSINEDQIQSILNRGSIKLNSEQLIQISLENGASDNVSFILIQNDEGQTITNVKFKN